MELSWENMVSVTAIDCPSLEGNNFGLLNRLSDLVGEIDYYQGLNIYYYYQGINISKLHSTLGNVV